MWKDLHKTFEENIFPLSQVITNETLTHGPAFWWWTPSILQWRTPGYYFRFLALGWLQLDGPLFTILSKCSAIVTSPVRPRASHRFFLPFIKPLTSRDNPFTNKAARAGWVSSFIVWNPECHRKRSSRWALKSATDLSSFCLHVWPISAGREDSRNSF